MASSYQFIEPGGAFPGISNTVSGTGAIALGVIAGAVDPTYGYAEFIYVRGASASTGAAGDACMIMQPGYSAMQLASGNTASQGEVCILPAALSNTNVFGWAQVYGVCDYAKLGTQGTGADGLPVVIGTTAGRLQTTAGATGYIVNGLKIAGSAGYSTTAASNSAILNMVWPVYDGRNQ
jgi:hypothetical protein